MATTFKAKDSRFYTVVAGMTYSTTASTALSLTGSNTSVPGEMYYRTLSPKKGRVTILASGDATLSGHVKSSADGTTYTTTVAFDTATGFGKMAEIDIPAYLQVQLATTGGDSTGSINVYLEVN
jgi:hypothetical protein